MKEIKCECGHINPYGTVLCEACGKVLEKETVEEEQKLLDMKYEGSARRSQTYNKTVVDKVPLRPCPLNCINHPLRNLAVLHQRAVNIHENCLAIHPRSLL